MPALQQQEVKQAVGRVLSAVDDTGGSVNASLVEHLQQKGERGIDDLLAVFVVPFSWCLRDALYLPNQEIKPQDRTLSVVSSQ